MLCCRALLTRRVCALLLGLFLPLAAQAREVWVLDIKGAIGPLLELYNPGAIFSGVLGGICLLLALYALQVLPVSFVGLGQHELDEMLASRERLNSDIQAILDAQTDVWGIKVSNLEIKHVDLDESMIRAIATQAESSLAECEVMGSRAGY